ncbi:RNA polymerase sigma factor [uncultured Tenacibaculum sp.]|uniref:RNA polymerase sigma factor n=1 Tax=uncultured Tenacibaculum sp. TaxID=174713 RepID=UPI00263A0D91|nr:RNA polymerase sigma factor [uncultured Tenacibaculum sp.]
MEKPIHKNICNENLFASFFDKHFKDLYNFLYYKFGERLSPEDKAQEAFLKVWQNCHRITPDKAKSFLYTTANNLMINQVNHEKVKLRYAETPQKQHTNESPEYVLEEKQYLDKIEKAVENLTEAQRVAFLLNRVEGKRFKEIAAILDISVKAVEKRIYGALKKLRKDIEGL